MSTENEEKEIILVDKPKGITSFGVIRVLRKKMGIKKMGHAGTLDPLASGLMIVGVGKGTKKLHELTKLSKVYDTDILLGISTTTGDMEGEVVEEKKVNEFSKDEVIKVLQSLVGEVELAVPAYSAVKVDGVRLYKSARAGGKVDLPVRKMVIHSIEFLSIQEASGSTVLSVRMNVASGVYVRSVAEEIGRRLGCPATVKELRRISIDKFKVEDAQKI